MLSATNGIIVVCLGGVLWCIVSRIVVCYRTLLVCDLPDDGFGENLLAVLVVGMLEKDEERQALLRQLLKGEICK